MADARARHRWLIGPGGMTLGALGMRGLTGQLTLSADGKAYSRRVRPGRHRRGALAARERRGGPPRADR